MKLAILSVLLWALQLCAANRQLYANALVPCDHSNGITAKELSILYDHTERKIYYNASVNVAFEGYVYADVDVWIYGLRAIQTRLNPCSGDTALKQLCPVNAGAIDIESQSDLSESVTRHIPGIAFTVPDIDAYVIAKVINFTTGNVQACVYIELHNTRSVEQTSVKWVTACLSGLGLFVSTLLVFLGTSVDSHNISAVAVLMLNYFQGVAFLAMEAVERVPPIASAWCENVAWSVGLVYSAFLEKIFRWYVQATGGDPATYKIYPTRPVLVQRLKKRAIDTIGDVAAASSSSASSSSAGSSTLGEVSSRSLDYLRNLHTELLTPEGGSLKARAHQLVRRISPVQAAKEAYANSSSLLVVYRGIERLAYKMGIEVTSAVLTTYTIFIFICVCVVFIYAVLWLVLRFTTKKERFEHDRLNEKPYENDGSESPASLQQPDNISTTFTSYEGSLSRNAYFFYLLPSLLKGTLLKLWFVAFPSIMVFSFWEWTHNDSPAVIVVSVFMFVVCLALLLSNVVRVYFIARRSKQETGTAAYMLYANAKVLQKYGYMYSMFDTKYYFFGTVYLAYSFLKSLFLAFAQKSGKTQALALFIIEFFMFIAVAHYKPFLSKAVNGIQITSHVVATLNAMFFLFFSNLMTQPLIVNGVMGVIFFVLNAAFSLVLLLYIIIYSILCVIWHKRSNGARVDHHAKDDRSSFILDRHGRTADEADELHALGKAAQADHTGQLDAQNSAWFQDGSGGAQNPFEPMMDPPTPHQRAERYSNVFSDSRTQTMTSEMSAGNLTQEQSMGIMAPGHRINESQSSFFNSKGESSSDQLVEEGEYQKKPSGFKGLFTKR